MKMNKHNEEEEKDYWPCYLGYLREWVVKVSQLDPSPEIIGRSPLPWEQWKKYVRK